MSPAAAAPIFSSLQNRNYKRYFFAQIASLIGNWMEMIAQAWLVLQLTGSGTALGLLVATQFLPVMLLSPYAGLVADRMDKRVLLVATQAAMASLSLCLGILSLSHHLSLEAIFVLAVLIGVVNAFDMPARQSFVFEMVGEDQVRNAVSLNSVTINVARAAGPALAGLVIGLAGAGWCFLANSVSFLGAIVVLVTLDKGMLHPAIPTRRSRGQVRAAIYHAAHTPELRVPLLMMVIIGTLTYEFPVSLALLAKESFDGGAFAFSMLTTALGAGAVLAGLWVAARGKTGLAPLALAAGALAIGMSMAALAPTVVAACAGLVVAGAGMIGVNAIGNTTLQLAVTPSMRGRVMALWSVAFIGSTPIGAPIIGFIGQQVGARWALGVGAMAALAGAILAVVASRPAPLTAPAMGRSAGEA